ncbi:acyltransferase domain-containing protein [Halalkalibacter sp. APA_J-10(15)]|uniref:acyltransferase domain-containing protein n=1 Tax=unclassified Halalkalibacter TaxID=2893063 RepID=UPI001FF39012|nr:acyltransferase domain-containing protein [Halalkalibacter sp. APA_J-10(15)]MCK0471191.1 acyltransferase domain-containing protein [Halalkalibacter sp. APA_J-10(15)]
MSSSIIFTCAGQGSHFPSMGKKLIEHYPTFRATLTELDRLVQKKLCISIVDILYTIKPQPFLKLLHTHTAIFMVEYSLAQLLIQSGIQPNKVIGMSLGEYVAAAITGMLNLNEALEAVIYQAQLIEKHCSLGGMLIIIAQPDLYQKYSLSNHSTLISEGDGSHFIVAGEHSDLLFVEKQLKANKIPYQSLPVQYAFHTQEMDRIKDYFVPYLHSLSFHSPKIPFLSSSSNEHFDHPQLHFWNVLRQPIQLEKGFRPTNLTSDYFIDLSPGGVIAHSLKRMFPHIDSQQVFPILSPTHKDDENLRHLLKSIKHAAT